MVSKSVAALMSEAAQKRGIKYGTYLCYEEDCDWAIPAYELRIRSEFITLSEIIGCLSRWNADYLLEIGREPEPEGYAAFKRDRERDRLRSEKSPDLIVCAQSTNNPEHVKVTTADDRKHYVTKDSYKPGWDSLNLLSECVLVSHIGDETCLSA
jgi:hypothetical protein